MWVEAGGGEVVMKDGECDRFEDRREDINKEIRRGRRLQETALIREEVILHSQLSDVAPGAIMTVDDRSTFALVGR